MNPIIKQFILENLPELLESGIAESKIESLVSSVLSNSTQLGYALNKFNLAGTGVKLDAKFIKQCQAKGADHRPEKNKGTK
jgi:hypothetical protein